MNGDEGMKYIGKIRKIKKLSCWNYVSKHTNSTHSCVTLCLLSQISTNVLRLLIFVVLVALVSTLKKDNSTVAPVDLEQSQVALRQLVH